MGLVTKKDFEGCLRACQKSADEMKSDTRDKALRFADICLKWQKGRMKVSPELLKEMYPNIPLKKDFEPYFLE